MKKVLYTFVFASVFMFFGVVEHVDAVCNPDTLSQVSYGQSSTAVVNLQECLIAAGHAIPAGATGYYGGQTQNAVKALYQTRLSMGDWHGKSVGPQGRSTLARSVGTQTQTRTQTRQLSPARTCASENLRGATFGAKGAHVTALQQCLMSAGFSIPAGATGYYGSQTQSAVKAFYRARLGMSNWHGNSVGPQGVALLGGTQTTAKQTKITGKAEAKDFAYKQASSESELLEYVEASNDGMYGFGVGVTSNAPALVERAAFEDTVDQSMLVTETADAGVAKSESSRHSETNVQVAGIDEPDIVKTDGEHLYISTQEQVYLDSLFDSACSSDMDCNANGKEFVETVDIVNAFPVNDLEVISNGDIKENGEMLLIDDMLIVFANDGLIAYDVTDTANPEKAWEREYGDNVRLVTARAMDEEVYMVTATYLNRNNPCPVVPLLDAGMSLSCRDVWVPKNVEHINTSYSVLKLDTENGEVDDVITFAGKNDNTVVAMFEDNLYIAHKEPLQLASVMRNFFAEELSDMLSKSTLERIEEILSYDISDHSKMTEISNTLEEAMAGMTSNERLRFETELENRGEDYITEHMRDLYRTAISRISTKTLSIKEMKTIPGYLLNQFSLDEYEGHLRVAVTVGERWGVGTQVNDMYVLDDELEIVGSVLDLGLTERIYSARFIGDRGYVVTFRQIDPFYVFDLSDPENPKMTGELKIPGYSSYLEAIDTDTVLGVGEENGEVKVSLFNVSNPEYPEESDVYRLNEYWSEVNSNHHAFLRDSEHEVVFIPAGNGGYVLSYAGDELSLKAAVSGYNVRRAVYIDDYLYIVGGSTITVLDENTWEEEATLDM